VTGGAERAADATGPELAGERARSLAEHFNELERWDDAEREARRGLQAEPDDVGLLMQLARSQFGRGRLEEAERTCAQGLAVQPQSVRIMVFLGLIQMQRGRMADAERTLLAALALDPQDTRGLSVYGSLMHAAGQLDKAEALYRRALAGDPDDALVHGHLARLQSERGRMKPAETSARTAARLAPDATLSHLELGLVALRRGHPFRARRHFREALRQDPANTRIEAAWLEADKCCRVIYLPFYEWSLLVQRLPGRQFTLWGVMMGMVFAADALGAPRAAVGSASLAYVLLCLYTWIAPALVAGWLRIVPPRIDR